MFITLIACAIIFEVAYLIKCAQHDKLVAAVRRLYYAGHWQLVPGSYTHDIDSYGLWTSVRDAAGFTPGLSPKPHTDGDLLQR